MTPTEDKVRELAERVAMELSGFSGRFGDRNKIVTVITPILTAFALDQQRVGADAMREVAAIAACYYCRNPKADGYFTYAPMNEHGMHRILHPNGESHGEYRCAGAALRALEPIPAPGKGEGT